MSCEGLSKRGGNEGRGGASAGFRKLHDLSRNVVGCGAGTSWSEPPEAGRVVVISRASADCHGLRERGRGGEWGGSIACSLELPKIGRGEGVGDVAVICGRLSTIDRNVRVGVSATSPKLHLVCR